MRKSGPCVSLLFEFCTLCESSLFLPLCLKLCFPAFRCLAVTLIGEGVHIMCKIRQWIVDSATDNTKQHKFTNHNQQLTQTKQISLLLLPTIMTPLVKPMSHYFRPGNGALANLDSLARSTDDGVEAALSVSMDGADSGSIDLATSCKSGSGSGGVFVSFLKAHKYMIGTIVAVVLTTTFGSIGFQSAKSFRHAQRAKMGSALESCYATYKSSKKSTTKSKSKSPSYSKGQQSKKSNYSTKSSTEKSTKKSSSKHGKSKCACYEPSYKSSKKSTSKSKSKTKGSSAPTLCPTGPTKKSSKKKSKSPTPPSSGGGTSPTKKPKPTRQPSPSSDGGGSAPTEPTSAPTKPPATRQPSPSSGGGGSAPTEPTSAPTTCPLPVCDTAPDTSQCKAASGKDVFFPSSRTASIVIDGAESDWDPVIDTCSGPMPMYEAGDSTKDYVSNAYTNYDCSSNELCILVLVNTTATDKDGNRFVLDTDEAQMWFKVYNISSSVQTPNSKGKKVIKNADDEVIGWEGCYDLPPQSTDPEWSTDPAGCWTNIEIHANFCSVASDGTFVICGTEDPEPGTTSTGKGGQDNAIGIFLECCSSS